MQANANDGTSSSPNSDDDAPEFTAEMFAQGEVRHGERIIRPYRGPGRPKVNNAKSQVTVRLDADLLDRLRSTGPGWQTRLNDAVRAWMNLSARPPA